jgi:hypothetical protein
VLASIFDSGAVYYPTILLVPIVVGVALARWRPDRRSLWILGAAVFAFALFDFAFDETRFEDLPFFVVLGVVMFGLGLLARRLAGKALGTRRASVS